MKKNLLKFFSLLVFILLIISGCEKEESDPTPSQLVSEGKEIVWFKIVNPAVTAVLDTTNKRINITVPDATVLTALATDISLAPGHTISPASGTPQNFSNPVTYTVTRPNSLTTTWTVNVSTSNIAVTGDITQSVTWLSGRTYVINSEIEVNNNAVLTIEPGTIIKFGTNGSLSVGYGSAATVLATGTATNPIVFTSSAALPAAGAWEGLTFYNGTLSNTVLEYCQVLYAGNNTNQGAVSIYGCDITMNNCMISNSGSYGIHTSYSNLKGGFVAFQNNAISNTAKYAIVLNANKIGTIGAGNTFTNAKGVWITGNYESSEPQTWGNHGVPYFITDEVEIDGSLTIAPGTVFKFETNGYISIAYSESTTFIADGGSANTPITFTSAATSPNAGAWRGIVIYDNIQNNSKFNFCVIEYAGQSPTNMGAILMTGNSSIHFTNNILRYSAGYGINLAWDAGFQSFSNNTISNCANHIITMCHKHLPELGTPNTFTNATNKGIELYGSAQYDNPVTWKKQTADFYIKGGECEIDGMLTIEAGIKFLFASDSYYYFGYNDNTVINAAGTSANKITFTTSSPSPAPGTWRGLYFDDLVQTNSALDYCQFQYTGMYSEPAIYTNSGFTVRNSTISNHSGTNPARYNSGTTFPAGTGNNFSWIAD